MLFVSKILLIPMEKSKKENMMPPGSRENLALSCVVFVRTKCRVVDGEYGILAVSSLCFFPFVCIYYDFVVCVCIHPICNAFFFRFL
jgi:hypothetical protein